MVVPLVACRSASDLVAVFVLGPGLLSSLVLKVSPLRCLHTHSPPALLLPGAVSMVSKVPLRWLSGLEVPHAVRLV